MSIQNLLEEHFFWLHKHPEESFFEHETTAYIKRALEAANIEILTTSLKTGLIARICAGDAKIANAPLLAPLALRADIDALPVTEASGVPYSSQKPGMMHACGHDFHTAALLGAALILKEAAQKDALPHTVLLVFQPAEERSGGAQSVLDTGALKEAKAVFGLHAAPNYPAGTVALKSGGTFAAVIAFKIEIKGTGGHAAMPHLCRDPISAAAQLILNAQTIVSRAADPLSSLVLSFTHIDSGTTWNVIPETALIEGTIRALTTAQARDAAALLGRFCAALETANGVQCKLDSWLDAPATNNNPALTLYAENCARKLNLKTAPYTPTMAGEDFALYQEKIPGVFLNFGVASPQGLHHPEFKADYTHLESAAKLLAALVLDFDDSILSGTKAEK